MRVAWVWFLLAVLVMPITAYAQAQAAYSFDLPAQPLSDSLHELGSQTGINIIFDPVAAADDSAPALRGRYSLKQALTKLLKGTNLTADFTNATTVVVKPIPHRSSPSSSRTSKHQSNTRELANVVVNGYAKALTATRSKTPLKDIPQSVSVISRETLNQQNATDLPSALRHVPGIRLSQNNSQQVYAYSRGFLVDSVHIDGGAPIGIVGGSVDVLSRDLAEYDSVEILRGSDALFGGMGNPGATVSLSRKMPTPYFQGRVKASVGSWDNYRLVGDVSGPLSKSKKFSGRLVVSGSDSDYFYDIAHKRGRMIYGVLQYNFTPSTSLSFGGSYENTRAINNFSGLPWNDNGDDPHLPRSLAITAPWSHSKTSFTEAFAKLQHNFNDNWKLRVNGMYQEQRNPEFITAIYRGPISAATGLLAAPLEGMGGPLNNKQKTINATLTGSFDWLGHTQHIMIGGDYEHSITAADILETQSSGLPLINPFDYDPGLYPPPDLSPGSLSATLSYINTIIQWGIYSAIQFQPVDDLSFIAGGRLSTYRYHSILNIKSDGIISPPSDTSYLDENKFTPYYGIVYDISPHYTAYASFADIYHTNAGKLTKENRPIPPSDGETMEVGVKGGWFDNSLNASLAAFEVKQRGVATYDPATPLNAISNCCYLTKTVSSKGISVQMSGAVTPHWELTAGYTYNEHKDTYSSILDAPPQNSLKLWTNYQLPRGHWSIGGGVRAYSDHSVRECYPNSDPCQSWVQFGQGSYMVADLRAAYEFKSWSMSLAINNLFDRTYYQTVKLLEMGNWYGTPRNFLLKIVKEF